MCTYLRVGCIIRYPPCNISWKYLQFVDEFFKSLPSMFSACLVERSCLETFFFSLQINYILATYLICNTRNKSISTWLDLIFIRPDMTSELIFHFYDLIWPKLTWIELSITFRQVRSKQVQGQVKSGRKTFKSGQVTSKQAQVRSGRHRFKSDQIETNSGQVEIKLYPYQLVQVKSGQA